MKTFNPNKVASSLLDIPASQMLYLAVGSIFRCEGRTVRLERIHDDGVVELLDLNTLGLLRIRDLESASLNAPTIGWMRDAYAEGILCLVGGSETTEQRQGRLALLDPDACAERDKKSLWRFSLAWRVINDSVVRTDAAMATWLDENYGREAVDLNFPKPSASALRRWVRSLEKRGKRSSSLVSMAGRPSGKSQLKPQVDALVEQAARWYWSRPNAKIVDAEAWLNAKIEEANAALPEATRRSDPYAKPSKEALRKRVNRLRCHETVAAKYGIAAAAKEYKGSGEPMIVDELLQVAVMDATTLEQVITFDDDWQLPACKVRITVLMDVLSRVILGWHVYAGPNRSETSAEAILSCMMPKEYDREMISHYPGLRYLFGRPAAILPDNELALVGPSSLPGLNETGITLLLPPVECPTAKATLERFFRTLKEGLAQLPGTMIDPKRAKDLNYDAVGAASLTLNQLRTIVSQVIASHNVSSSKGLDGQSPLEVWMRHSAKRATPAFEDVDCVRRLLGRTHKALLTRDGIEFDGIRYRDVRLVQDLLDNMSHTADRKVQRKDGSATVEVKIRRQDGNLDTIDVYDTILNDYVTLPSTQPEYTDRLSAWEHDYFREQAKARREEFKTKEGRLTSKAITLKMIDEMAPQVPFQQRRDMAALYQSHQIDRLSRGMHSGDMPADIVIAPQRTGEAFREDEGLPSAMNGKRETTSKASHRAPMRPEGYGGITLDEAAASVDWDNIGVSDAEPADAETGIFPKDADIQDNYEAGDEA